ncbi:isochorismatase domain-containing protein 2 isoform X1 [Tamandua tetradactyla]|uniref:isochorismatase domain-containing protein 2 isoform X1 n=1 Tax=Tamandua tetradactyla TaxID=48850 RepID=UPI0040538F15
MAAVGSGLGRVLPGSSVLFLCDMQEKFRHSIVYFPQVVSVAARMLQVARLLGVPALLTEQYPQGLGPTVPELGAEGMQPVPKTCFSMVPALRGELDAQPQLRSVLLCGIEAQACILNTALDLLDRGLQVHVVVDACSSRRWTGWWPCRACGRVAPSSPPARGSSCSSWGMLPTPSSRRSRRSSRSLPRTAGCWASSKARTPSSGDPPQLSCHPDPSKELPVPHPKSGAVHRECRPSGGGRAGRRLAIGRPLPEMQMKLLEVGSGLAELGCGRGWAPRREREGVLPAVWDPASRINIDVAVGRTILAGVGYPGATGVRGRGERGP